jgi:cobalt-precorrin-5B (C1)-methyltransferase
MREETAEHVRPLRYGYTTGACATAASLAAAYLLLSGTASETAEIILSKGQTVRFALAYCQLTMNGAEAAVRKDAGDDPDVTHAALVFTQVTLTAEPGVRFRAGEGVGTVTLPGLPIPVGEPAINPVPRRMMIEHLQGLASERDYVGGFEVTIGVENGAQLAARTLNPRLGIVGGLSILGTTGIVRPFSCSAYIASIHQAIDVARANGLHHLAACTGAASAQLLCQHYHLLDLALIEMGDFVGAVLKYLHKAPVEKLSLAGGFGKISKLAAGQLDLHSRTSRIDFAWLAQQVSLLGADTALRRAIQTANTSQHALELAQAAGLGLGDWICQLARRQALHYVPAIVAVEVWAVDRQGRAVGHAGFV